MLNALLDALPDGELKDSLLYSSCKILYVEFELSFEAQAKNKYIVIIDNYEPPLFFFINSNRRGDFNKADTQLFKRDYPFFTKDVCFLHYLKAANSYDFSSIPPTREDLLKILRAEPDRVNGTLRIEEANQILEGIEDNEEILDLTGEEKERVITALTEFVGTNS